VLTRSVEKFGHKAPHLVASPSISFVEGDIREFDFPDGRFDYVIHAATEASAALNERAPEEMLSVCIDGTRRLLDFAVRCRARKVLLTSSGAVYGKQPATMRHVSEEYLGGPDPLNVSSAYAEGKRLSEHLCSLCAQRNTLETAIARCYAFVGPHLPLDAHFAIGNFIRDALRGGPIIVKGDGTPYRSYLYAADMTLWLWTILIRGRHCYPYNVGSDEDHSIEDIARRVASVVNPDIQVQIQLARREDVPPERYVPSIHRACKELHLRVSTSLSDAIMKTYTWAKRSVV